MKKMSTSVVAMWNIHKNNLTEHALQSKTLAVISMDDQGNLSGLKVHRQKKGKPSESSKVIFTTSIGKHHPTTPSSAANPAVSSQSCMDTYCSHSEPAPESPIKFIRERRASSPPMMSSEDGTDGKSLPFLSLSSSLYSNLLLISSPLANELPMPI